MKRTILQTILLASIILLSGCPHIDPPEDELDKIMVGEEYCGPDISVISKSAIAQYWTLESFHTNTRYSNEEHSIEIIGRLINPNYSILSTGDDAIMFQKLAAKHNDTAYNGLVSYVATLSKENEYDTTNIFNTSSADVDIESLNVTSSEPWDAKHPAGTSLNDIIIFSGRPYQQFIDSNYDSIYIRRPIYKFEKRLSDMQPRDFYLTISPGFELKFTEKPQDCQLQHITVEINLDDGRTITTQTTIDFTQE